MDAKFSPRVRAILSLSHQEAQRLGNAYVGLEHLFLGMLKEGGSSAIKILENLNLNIEVFSKKLEASVRTANSNQHPVLALPLTKQAERVLKFTYIIAKEFHSDIVRSEHLMLAILHETSGSYQEGTGKLGSYGMWNHPRGHVWNVFVRPASS